MDTPELEDVGIISPFFKLLLYKINFSSCLKIEPYKLGTNVSTHVGTSAYNNLHYLRNEAAA